MYIVNDKQNVRNILLIVSLFLYLGLGFVIYNLQKYEVFAGHMTNADIISETNYIREMNGLPPLAENPDLTATAYLKAYDMLEKQYWDHIAPDGKTPWDFIKNSDYDFKFAGENLARDFSTPSELLEGWMDSPTHRANILNPNYHDIGVAIVDGTFKGDDITLIVAFYASTFDEVDYVEPNYNNEKIKILYPLENQYLNDSFVTISGTVCCFENISNLSIYDNDTKIEDIVLTDNKWTFRFKTSLNDGVHNIVVKDTKDQDVYDNVKFVVDSISPYIDESSIQINKASIGYKLRFSSDSTADRVIILLNKLLIYADEVGINEYEAILPFADSVNRAYILAFDKSNNMTKVDITNLIVPENSSIKLFIANSIFKIKSTNSIYLLVILVLLLLFIVDIILYRKFKLVRYFGHDLLILFTIVISLSISILYQFTGVIL